jgi:maleylpyruvate isomerase
MSTKALAFGAAHHLPHDSEGTEAAVTTIPTSSGSDTARPSGFDLGLALDEMAQATDRVLDTLHELSDDDVRAPSRLPGWTRAHVLTHIARNADGLVNLVTWAGSGQETPMYPGGREGRNADIEAGAGRHAADLEGDIEASSERLLAALSAMPPEGLDRTVRMLSGTEHGGWDIPFIRIREVEIHHVDLGAGYGPADWEAPFVTRTLDFVTRGFLARGDVPVLSLRGTDSGRSWEVGRAGAELRGPDHELLAWVVGRSDGASLVSEPDGPIPAAPPWS